MFDRSLISEEAEVRWDAERPVTEVFEFSCWRWRFISAVGDERRDGMSRCEAEGDDVALVLANGKSCSAH